MSADDAVTVDRAEVDARLVLSRLSEPGDGRLGEWVEAFGVVEVLDRIRSRHSGLADADRYRARAEGVDLDAQREQDVAAAARVGARLVVPGTPEWPSQLDDLGPCRPLLLWVRGPADLRLCALHSVAVVGARSATRYGDLVAGELAAGLAERRWTVVSGGAYGIDAAAHAGALAAGGVTFAVLATGVDQTYPKGNEALLARVLDTGLLVSELHPGAPPWRSRFLERNRVIAALTRGTVVVEAAARSGAISTAARALELNRHVMGVPGPVTSAMSTGVHRRIRSGQATLVTSVTDVLELVGPLDGAVDVQLELAARRPTDELGADATAVHDALAVGRTHGLPVLARAAGLTEPAALQALGLLVLKGLAEQAEDGWRARTRSGS